MIQYRIQWINLQTGYKGHGSWLNEIDYSNIEYLNKEYYGIMKHWIVSLST